MPNIRELVLDSSKIQPGQVSNALDHIPVLPLPNPRVESAWSESPALKDTGLTTMQAASVSEPRLPHL